MVCLTNNLGHIFHNLEITMSESGEHDSRLGDVIVNSKNIIIKNGLNLEAPSFIY